jgi:2-amino-4-hydroxy-6-hydroxymethyldihydropteridine diphosphokinase
MRFEDWEPVYVRILDEFGFSRIEDERSARWLEALLISKDLCDEACIRRRIMEEVTICGDALSLEADLASIGVRGTIMSADGATKELMDVGIRPDVIVTDLDGDIGSQIEANRQGALVVVHAHGDNIIAIERYVKRFDGPIAGTTQSKPSGSLFNFGGFTDGDRAVMLARHFGAKRIWLLGFDFKEPRQKGGRGREIKSRKLEWARALIFDLNPAGTCLSIP